MMPTGGGSCDYSGFLVSSSSGEGPVAVTAR